MRLVNPRDDSVRHLLLVLCPERAVLSLAASVIIALPGKEEDDIIERVEPGEWRGEPSGEGNPSGEEDFPEVVDMPGETPEPGAEELPLNTLGFHEAEESGGLGIELEVELLEIGSPGERVTGEKDDEGQAQDPGGDVKGGVGNNEGWERVEKPVEAEAAPGELEADVLIKEIIGVQVDFLKIEVLDNEPRHLDQEHDHGSREVPSGGLPLRKGAREEIDLHHDSPHEVQVHLEVEEGEQGPPRVQLKAKEEVVEGDQSSRGLAGGLSGVRHLRGRHVVLKGSRHIKVEGEREADHAGGQSAVGVILVEKCRVGQARES